MLFFFSRKNRPRKEKKEKGGLGGVRSLYKRRVGKRRKVGMGVGPEPKANSK